MIRIVILCLLVACGSVSEPVYYPEPAVATETDSTGVTTVREVVAPQLAPGHYPTVIYAGPEEMGDWYAMIVPGGDAWVELADTITKRDGAVITIGECSPTGAPIAVSAHPGSSPPTGSPLPTGSIAGGLGQRTVPAPGPGPWLLAVQFDAGVCLRGLRGPDPIAPGLEWWVTRAGVVRDMAIGGGSPSARGRAPGTRPSCDSA